MRGFFRRPDRGATFSTESAESSRLRGGGEVLAAQTQSGEKGLIRAFHRYVR